MQRIKVSFDTWIQLLGMLGSEWVLTSKGVPRRGFEPLTCPLGGGRAIQLCHRGVKPFFVRIGVYQLL